MVSPADPRRLLEDFNKILSGVPAGDLTHIHRDSREEIVRMMARNNRLCNENFWKYLEHPSFFIGNSITLDILPDDDPKNYEFVDRNYYVFLNFLGNLLHIKDDLADRITTLRLIFPVTYTLPLNMSTSIGRNIKHVLYRLMLRDIVWTPWELRKFSRKENSFIQSDAIKGVYEYEAPLFNSDYEDLQKVLAPIARCKNLKCLTVAFQKSPVNYDRPKPLLCVLTKYGVAGEVGDTPYKILKINSYDDLNEDDKRLVDGLPAKCIVEFNRFYHRHRWGQDNRLLSRTAFPNLFSALCALGKSKLEALELLNQHFDCDVDLEHGERDVLRNLKRLTWECFDVDSSNIKQFLDYCDTLESLKLSFGKMHSPEVPMTLQKLHHLTVIKYPSSTCESSKVGEQNRVHFDWKMRIPVKSDSEDLKWMLQHGVEVSIDAHLLRLEDWLSEDWIIPAGNYITKLRLVELAAFPQEAADVFLKNCTNLHSVKVKSLATSSDSHVKDYFLNKLFTDSDRAMKLRCLEIYDHLSDETLEMLFSICNKLEILTIKNNKINDNHILVWINGGARPSEIALSLTDLSDAGLIALIEACGSNLRKLSAFDIVLNNPNAVIDTLIRHCPLLEYINCGETINRELLNIYDTISHNFISRIKILQP